MQIALQNIKISEVVQGYEDKGEEGVRGYKSVSEMFTVISDPASPWPQSASRLVWGAPASLASHQNSRQSPVAQESAPCLSTNDLP